MPKSISVLHVANGGDSATQVTQPLEDASEPLSVSRVETAAAALEYLDGDGADCVVLESGDDGLDRLDAVRSDYPDVPCVLVTDGDGETVRRALAAGAADCLRASGDRPITELLVTRIENVVESRRRPTAGSDGTRLVEELPDGVVVIDEDRMIRDANAAAGDIFGTDVAALCGQSVAAIAETGHFEASDLTRFRDAIDAVLAGGEPTRTGFTVDDTSRTYDARLAPRSGRSDGVAVIIRDVTERVARENELEQYETLLRTIPDTVVLMDTDGYHVEVHGFEGWSGYTRSDLVGEHFSMTTAEEYLERANEVAGELFRDDDREKATFEMEIETSDGATVPFENHLTLLPPDEDGHIPGTMSVLRNISERKARERQLNGLNERLRDIVGADSPEGMADMAVAAARDVLGVDFAAVRFHDEDDGLVPVAASPDVVAWPDDPSAEGVEDAPVRAAFEADEMRICHGDRPAGGGGDGDAATRTDMVFPLGEHGVVQFGTTETEEVEDRAVSLAEILAGNLESALDRAFSLAELEERERVLERYETVVESTHDGIAILDEHGEHLLVNDVYAEALGIDRDEILGTTIDEVGPDDLTWGVPDDLEELWLDAWETAHEEGHAEFRYESIAEFPRGRTVLDNRVTGIKQEDGTVVFVVVGRDISDQYERQEQIEQLHEATRELMAAESTDEVAEEVVEAVDTILGFPANVVRLLDDEGERLAPVTVTDRAMDLLDDRSSLSVEESRLGEAFREGEVLLRDDLRKHTDRGPESDVRSLLSLPIGDYGLLSIVDDEVGAYDESDVRIAEIVAANAEAAFDRVEKEAALRGRKEALARQNERLDRFASILSHDLRNPLNVAQGNLTFVAEQVDDTRHVDDVASALDRMEALIADVLTLTREGDDAADVGPVALRSTLDSCWASVDTADATLRIETDQTVLADDGRLRQLFENLFRNGIDHVGSDVTITVGDTDEGFYVEDDGHGIPLEDRDSIFDAGYTSCDEGTGFGLNIVETVAEAHGWDVSITDGSDGGARFEFSGVDLASQ